MASNKKKRPFKFKGQKQRQHRGGGGGGGGGGGAQTAVLAIDFEALPGDLNEERYDEIVSELPKSRRKTKPKPVEHDELLGMNLNEMHEVAEKEKVPEFEGRTRRQAIWEITTRRLRAHMPIVVGGTLDVFGKDHHFLRSHFNDYMPAADDVFVPHSVVERYGLARGMTIRGTLRPPAEGERYLCLWEVESIDGAEPELAAGRAPFKELVPLYPEARVILEGTDENPLEMRIVDLITPIGRGQRGLIVAPPRTGKTVLLQMLAKSIVHNAPDAHLIILLVDERPEEVTDFQRSIHGEHVEVVSSTFDEPASRHLAVADMAIEKAKRMVESGNDVVILLDSITRLARASNTEAPSNGKLLSGGLEATALQFPKRFFGAARNIEHGGSLTILGTALIETGSKMDEVIFEEFKGTGNMEIVLDRRLSDRRIFPAIDINRSGTRKEELLFTEEEIERVWMLRKVLNELDPVEAMEMLITKMSKTSVNGQFLMTIGG
ncbi:MAG: transcription termination factor Rho [bacterium]|nr:transcription termination factor Rho [bacterium]